MREPGPEWLWRKKNSKKECEWEGKNVSKRKPKWNKRWLLLFPARDGCKTSLYDKRWNETGKIIKVMPSPSFHFPVTVFFLCALGKVEKNERSFPNVKLSVHQSVISLRQWEKTSYKLGPNGSNTQNEIKCRYFPENINNTMQISHTTKLLFSCFYIFIGMRFSGFYSHEREKPCMKVSI